jgi:hypothetical protein
MALTSVTSERVRFIRVTYRAVALGEGGSVVYRTVNPNDLTWRGHSLIRGDSLAFSPSAFGWGVGRCPAKTGSGINFVKNLKKC